jgi:hypothetical protein
MLLKATMPGDKRNQNSDLFFRQTHEVFGCLQLWVFNPKLGLFAAVKGNPVFIVSVNDPLSMTVEHKAPVHKSGGPSPFAPAYQLPYCP